MKYYQLSIESLSSSSSESSSLSFSFSSFIESFLQGDPFSFTNINGLSSKLYSFFNSMLILVIFFLKSQRQRSQIISQKKMMLIPLAYFASQLQGMKQRMKKSQMMGKCSAFLWLKVSRQATLPYFLLKQFRQTSSPCQKQQVLANLAKKRQYSKHFYETNSPTLIRQTVRARSNVTFLVSLISVCLMTLMQTSKPYFDGVSFLALTASGTWPIKLQSSHFNIFKSYRSTQLRQMVLSSSNFLVFLATTFIPVFCVP